MSGWAVEGAAGEQGTPTVTAEVVNGVLADTAAIGVVLDEIRKAVALGGLLAQEY